VLILHVRARMRRGGNMFNLNKGVLLHDIAWRGASRLCPVRGPQSVPVSIPLRRRRWRGVVNKSNCQLNRAR